VAITANSLRFYKAERMTDTPDGGGRMSGTEIVSDIENQIFDDISDVDYAAGDVSIRKCYALVKSADTDKYLDAGFAIFSPPVGAGVSVLAFSTGSFYDERSALVGKLEGAIIRGGRWNGYLWSHGTRSITIWQKPEAVLPTVNGRMFLVASGYSEVIWITRVITTDLKLTDEKGDYYIKQVVMEIAEPIQHTYIGSEPQRLTPTAAQATVVYDSNYDPYAVEMVGIKALTATAAFGDYSVKVANLYSPVIPTALAETPIADTTPAASITTLVLANTGTVSVTTSLDCIGPTKSWFLGSGIYPGTLSISVSGSTIVDVAGSALLGATVIGSVNYSAGVIAWNASCPAYGAASKTATWKPAAAPIRVGDTDMIPVTLENQGFVYVTTLEPIPSPGSLRVSYRAAGTWYSLADSGNGVLTGVNSSYGSGVLSLTTGTVQLTLGALPDVDSAIMLTWGVPVTTVARGGETLASPVWRGKLANAGTAPGTISASWTVSGTTYTLTDNGAGVLSGTGGAGTIRYSDGYYEIRPSALPPSGTELSITYSHGPVTQETFAAPARGPGGELSLTLSAVPRQGMVEVDYPVIITKDGETVIDSRGGPIQVIKRVRDNGAGLLVVPNALYGNGTVDYNARYIAWNPEYTAMYPVPTFRSRTDQSPGSWGGTPGAKTTTTWFMGTVMTSCEAIFSNGDVTVKYRPVESDTTITETSTLLALEIDLNMVWGETIATNSLRFRLAGAVYVQTAGVIYRDPSATTGVGTLAGTLDAATGVARITSWVSGGSPAVILDALTTQIGAHPVSLAVFATVISPIRSGSLQLRWVTLEGVPKSKTVDEDGYLQDTDATIQVDPLFGVVVARFGHFRPVSALTPEELASDWYDPDATEDIEGVESIWKPQLVLSDSIIYNAVGQTYMPPDSDLLGVNAAKLPPDGKALILRPGMLALVHHTDSLAASSLTAGQTIDCGRTRLYRVVIEDSAGMRLAADLYTLNRELGTLTMADPLPLDGFTGPYAIRHTVADLRRIRSADINGTVTLLGPTTHAYPSAESFLSGVVYIGTLQARVSNLFAQATWTSVWSDALIGSAPLAQYNNALFPVAVTNESAYPDRFLVQFTSATDFRVIGENLGIIGVGAINVNCEPINTLTGEPYFTIDYRGWGIGWATGNCLRFNVAGACYPIDVVRAVQPGDPVASVDKFELLLTGNVDSP
jgi:hypothetical protein